MSVREVHTAGASKWTSYADLTDGERSQEVRAEHEKFSVLRALLETWERRADPDKRLAFQDEIIAKAVAAKEEILVQALKAPDMIERLTRDIEYTTARLEALTSGPAAGQLLRLAKQAAAARAELEETAKELGIDVDELLKRAM